MFVYELVVLHSRSMSHLDSEGSSKPWKIHSGSSEPSPSQTGFARQEAPWKSLGTSMSAISFGFVATAVLISMFLIMAIFEHLFRPNAAFSSSQNGLDNSLESRQMQKLGNPQIVRRVYIFQSLLFSFRGNHILH